MSNLISTENVLNPGNVNDFGTFKPTMMAELFNYAAGEFIFRSTFGSIAGYIGVRGFEALFKIRLSNRQRILASSLVGVASALFSMYSL